MRPPPTGARPGSATGFATTAEAARLMEEQVIKYPASGGSAYVALLARPFVRGCRRQQAAGGELLHCPVDHVSQLLLREPCPPCACPRWAQQPNVAPGARTRFRAGAHRAANARGRALPENDPHLIKARLLANAALNEYIAPEIQASGTSPRNGARSPRPKSTPATAENVRALQAIKRSGVGFYTLPVSEVPE